MKIHFKVFKYFKKKIKFDKHKSSTYKYFFNFEQNISQSIIARVIYKRYTNKMRNYFNCLQTFICMLKKIYVITWV